MRLTLMLIVFTPGVVQADEAGSPASIQVASSAVQANLSRLKSLASGQQIDEAVELYRSLVERQQLGLVPRSTSNEPPNNVRVWQTVREAATYMLRNESATAPRLLDLYRQQVDSTVELLYRKASKDYDRELLRQVAEQYRLSRVGGLALMLLGELALQQGQLQEARQHWEDLASDFEILGHQRASDPEPSFARGDILARLILVSILEGNRPRAQQEIDELERLEPKSEGLLGGQRGPYVPMLRQQLARPRGVAPHVDLGSWGTYGGSNERARTIPPIGRLGAPLWHIPWSQVDPKRAAGISVLFAKSGSQTHLPYPLIDRDRVVVAPVDTLGDVLVVELSNGHRSELQLPPGADRATNWLPLSPNPNSAMALSSDAILYARLFDEPDESTRTPFARSSRDLGVARLIAADLAAQKKRLFEIELSRPDWEGLWTFDGGPLIQGGSVFLIAKRNDGIRFESHLASFDRRTGRLNWKQFISSNSASSTFGESRTNADSYSNQHLLSYADGNILVNSNDGVVAAVESRSGAIRWIAQYPRMPATNLPIDRNEAFRRRRLNPCLIIRDQVIVAPRDSDQLFSFDWATGQLRWSTPPEQAADATFLLGMQGESLIATGDYAYWIDLTDGRIKAQFPPPVKRSRGHARPALIGAGRGLVTESEFVWPTRSEIIVFAPLASLELQVLQRLDLSLVGLSGGHLVPSPESLVMSGPQGLTALRRESHSNEAH